MSEIEYDTRYATWLTGAGITPPSNPINLKGTIKAMLANWPVAGGGSVTTVSVASANGFAGTVATPTTTPAITMSTSITGLLKGNGTAISAAVASTDYIGATSGSAIQKASSGGLTAATAGTDYPATGVITGAGPIGSAGALPVLTYNNNGQLTAVTTTGTVGTVAATDTSIVIGGTGTAPTIATGTLDVIATQHAPAANWSNNSHKITSLSNGSASSDAAAFGQIPVPANGYGIGGNTGATPTPAVSLTTAAGNLGGDYTLTTSLATFLTSSSLAIGTWLVHFNGLVSISTSFAAVEIQVNTGTATATLTGQTSTETNEASVNVLDSIGLTLIAVVTVAGTLVFQAKGNSTNPVIKTSTPTSTFTNATGYTAVRIA